MGLTPRPHQVEALEWCRKRENPVLFWEQRTGKTLVAILHAKQMEYREVLVIAPNSALESWESQLTEEGERWTRVTGTKAQRLRLLKEGGAGWYLVNREIWQSVPDLGTVRKWDLVIMDESASIIRYPGTGATLYYLRRFEYQGPRMVLTGRPDPQNELLPYWNQMAWANGGSWMGSDSFWGWRYRFFRQAAFKWVPRRGAKERIMAQVARDASVLSREDIGRRVAKDTCVIKCYMPTEVRDIYRRVEEEFVLQLQTEDEEGVVKDTKWEVVRYTWMRQLTAGFIEGTRVWDGKLQALNRLTRFDPRFDGARIVVVGCFTGEIGTLAKEWMGGPRAILTGDTPIKERGKIVDRFNRGELRALFCQVQVIDTGMDLHGADAIVYTTLPLSVLSWVQSQDRILGDLTRRKARIYVLECAGSIDEHVRESVMKADRKSHGLLREIRERIVRSVGGRSRSGDGVGALGPGRAGRVRSSQGRAKGI